LKFIIVGLGSMGKRRIRCLNYLGYNEIIGYDIREDRMEEAKAQCSLEILEIIKN
jgi:threonine dehydrogenase-like Zn-dependent dehydrogenase